MSDVSQILGSHTQQNVSTKQSKKTNKKSKLQSRKKIPRELANLLGDNQAMPPLVPENKAKFGTSTKSLGKERVTPWAWKPFRSSARRDELVLSHWVRKHAEFPDYPFARFSKRVEIVQYTDEEYDQLCSPGPRIKDPNVPSNPLWTVPPDDHDASWSREQTDHLFDLARRFDLRWPIMYDRWQILPRKSLSDMKLRFYTVFARVVAARTAGKSKVPAQTVATLTYYMRVDYQREAEERRRRAVDFLFRRQTDDINEENQLLKELKDIDEALRRARSRMTASTPIPADALLREEYSTCIPTTTDSKNEKVDSTVSKSQIDDTSAPVSVGDALIQNSNNQTSNNQKNEQKMVHSWPQSSKSTVPYTEAASLALRKTPLDLGTMNNGATTSISTLSGTHKHMSGRDGARVMLRSEQLASPLDAYPKDSRTMKKVMALCNELNVPSAAKLMPCAAVWSEYTKLRRDIISMFQLQKAVVLAEKRAMTLQAQVQALASLSVPAQDALPTPGQTRMVEYRRYQKSVMKQQAAQQAQHSTQYPSEAMPPPSQRRRK